MLQQTYLYNASFKYYTSYSQRDRTDESKRLQIEYRVFENNIFKFVNVIIMFLIFLARAYMVHLNALIACIYMY